MTDEKSIQDDDHEDDLEAPEDGEQPGGDSRRLARTRILFIVLPLLLIAGAGAGAWFTGLADPILGGDRGEQGAEEHAQASRDGAIYYDLPQMLVNLNTAGRRTSFLKIVVSLELTSEADKRRLREVMPRIIDNFQVYLRELRVEDLRGSAGLYRLREELLFRVNAAVSPARVTDVLFKEMLVQ